jgi:hypothetical protein
MIRQQIAIGQNTDVLTVEQDGMRSNKMGKHIKTQLDYDMIEKLLCELFKLQPSNPILQHYMNMDSFEGAELRKSISKST